MQHFVRLRNCSPYPKYSSTIFHSRATATVVMYSNTSCRQSYLGWLCLVLSISLTAAQMYSQGAISSISLNSSFPSSVMLTFDDGPHEIITPLILDVLKAKSVKATFFLVGFKALLHPEIVLRISQEGHEVANHGNNEALFSSDNCNLFP